MTQSEKTSAVIKGEDPALDTGFSDFGTVLDRACDGLIDRQIKYSIQRIHEMKERLSNLESELDEFLSSRK